MISWISLCAKMRGKCQERQWVSARFEWPWNQKKKSGDSLIAIRVMHFHCWGLTFRGRISHLENY
jgi:hypothetical protein